MARIPLEITFEIPDNRIALYPAERRDDSQLLVYSRERKSVIHSGLFPDVAFFLNDSLLVRNNTQVMPVSVPGTKAGGGKVHLLFIPTDFNLDSGSIISALINPGRRLKPGQIIHLPSKGTYRLIEKSDDGKWNGIWDCEEGSKFTHWLKVAGNSPLPPYIRREPEHSDLARYQTIYAKKPGSLAAPTAGLHFTETVLNRLEEKGCQVLDITLNVGLGTFIPIRSDDISNHLMHSETYEILKDSAEIIMASKTIGTPITAIGTTVVRALEDSARKAYPLKGGIDSANIFIHPPFEFIIIDKLLTNFHRPDSTLIQLMAAFIGWDGVNCCYETALDSGFRFFSYGDSMLVI